MTPVAITRPLSITIIWLGPLQRRAPVRHHQRGHARPLEQAIPEHPLGIDIERAGEIVEHVHLGRTHEHPGRRAPLDLPAGELHAPHPNHRLQPVLQGADVLFHHRRVQGGVEVDRILRQPEQDVVAQRLAEQPRACGV